MSLFRGATPTRAEIFLELKVPSSGREARSLLPACRSGRKDRRETFYGHKICLTTGRSNLISDCLIVEG
ncbi:MAG: hypothetical protein JRH08_19305, partial [Deltaproteobacteria bacterium]|nr:hypothetical protein [Deltaproteobacteria bacterium]MBW2127723.1 hypothetical protein [Deltaproteobacteria bacterium]